MPAVRAAELDWIVVAHLPAGIAHLVGILGRPAATERTRRVVVDVTFVRCGPGHGGFPLIACTAAVGIRAALDQKIRLLFGLETSTLSPTFVNSCEAVDKVSQAPSFPRPSSRSLSGPRAHAHDAWALWIFGSTSCAPRAWAWDGSGSMRWKPRSSRSMASS